MINIVYMNTRLHELSPDFKMIVLYHSSVSLIDYLICIFNKYNLQFEVTIQYRGYRTTPQMEELCKTIVKQYNKKLIKFIVDNPAFIYVDTDSIREGGR